MKGGPRGPVATPPQRPQARASGGSGYRGPLPRQEDELVEKITWLMDRSIPIGGGYSIGLDPIIGLVPGFGDIVGTAISSILVVQGFRAGVPKPTLLRMVANVAIDSVIGAIPFLGDLFDFAFKANTKNLQLYREGVQGVRDTRRDTLFLVGLLMALGVIVAIPVLLVIWAVQATFTW